MKPRKVILDVDPGIDDAVAICMALFDPRLEVLAITATGGNVSPEQATRNVQAIVEQLDPPRWPRVGAASEPDKPLPANSYRIFGSDGLGEAGFSVAELHNRHASDKVLCDEVRTSPEAISVVALGPLTNIARAIHRDREFPQLVDQIFVMGGTYSGPGNVTPAAEFNFYSDPASARFVLQQSMTTSLIPLDITNQVELRFDLLDELPSEESRAGRFLRKILPYTFRAHRQELGVEGIHMHDAVALTAVTNPELMEWESARCDIEVSGEITTGACVVDRRSSARGRTNIHVATSIDAVAARDCILRGLSAAGKVK